MLTLERALRYVIDTDEDFRNEVDGWCYGRQPSATAELLARIYNHDLDDMMRIAGDVAAERELEG